MHPYLTFWGKARGERQGEPSWHPVAYHCLDVAAVAAALLDAFPRQSEHLARMLGTTRENLSSLLVSLIALHDIGKFAVGFQAKSPLHFPACLDASLRLRSRLNGDHAEFASIARTILGLQRSFGRWTGAWTRAQFDELWHTIAGHHGKPRTAVAAVDAGVLRFDLPRPALDAALAFHDEVLSLFPHATAIPGLRQGDRRLAILTWYAAGLTVAADWIGSNRDWFGYERADQGGDVAAYWPKALSKAKTAVKLSGLLPAKPNMGLSLADLLPAGKSPSPLQEALASCELPGGPSLTLLEETTGGGKTEAALMLAGRLVASGHASGLYFALPTMATADAMYRRMVKAYRKLFAADAKPSLVLAHGKRQLNDGFQGSIGLAGSEPISATGNYPDEASAVCAGWLADDRRKAFLAHVGVGTIDQALLGVLPSKYQSLRLWGIADKVLICDEIHSYDTYVSRELERVLEFHAALGGSAILLSATLPIRQRRQLLAAFERGLGSARASEAEPPKDYPLVSSTSAQGRSYNSKLATRADRYRKLAVGRLATSAEAVAALVGAARQGAAVAWVRNAVDDAIEASEMLEAAAPDFPVVLLHSRFAIADRLTIEEKVRTILGPGDHDHRRGFILVGTQILEASLDYDVDLMVTDLAPIDLIIQRAGRIWRHTDRKVQRPLASPELLVLAPDPANVMASDWYAGISQRAPHVYAHHGIVWRSASCLFQTGHIATPAGVRSLIEAVYAREWDDLDDIPEALHTASRKAVGSESAARSFANTNLLALDDGYAGRQDIWTADVLTQTRLGEPVTVFRLAIWRGDAVVPLCGGDCSAKSWALSEIAIASRRADGESIEAGAVTAVDAAKATWAEWERKMPILLLAAADIDQLSGVAKKGEKPISFRYCAARGLTH